MVSYDVLSESKCVKLTVLILIVVEDGLVLVPLAVGDELNFSLNPYCSGRWSRTS